MIALLRGTRYFDLVDERVHGWPETDPAQRFWYGTWWSGVEVVKANGRVTYRHRPDGADNNGIRTAPFLEGACYAHLMWRQAQTAHLVHRLARGYSSWAMAMRRDLGDTAGALLARAHYPESVQSNDGGRALWIDYSADRPGVDGSASEYVHLPSNPDLGEIWIKNKRSKDDMGLIFRSLIQAQACAPFLGAAGATDVAQATSLFATWSRRVEADGWSIATLDKNAQVVIPPVTETFAHYITIGNVECPGVLMIRLLGAGDPGSWDCGTGISTAEQIVWDQLSKSAQQNLRTHHEGAANVAFFTGHAEIGSSLLDGLAARAESDLAAVTGPNPPANINPSDIAALLIHSAAAGLPLTSAEVRWLHGRLHLAYLSYLSIPRSTYDVFDSATPDGAYPFEPIGDGLAFGSIGSLIGECAAPYRNPATRPVLNCARLLAAF